MPSFRLPGVFAAMLLISAVVSGCNDAKDAERGLQPTAPAMDEMDYTQNPWVYLYLSSYLGSRVETFQQVNRTAYLQNYGTIEINGNYAGSFFKETIFNYTSLSGSHPFGNCNPGDDWVAKANFYAYSSLYGTLTSQAEDPKTCYLA